MILISDYLSRGSLPLAFVSFGTIYLIQGYALETTLSYGLIQLLTPVVHLQPLSSTTASFCRDNQLQHGEIRFRGIQGAR